MKPDISIIIPTYKRHKSLDRILDSISDNLPNYSEVIVSDQSPDSRDKSLQFCKKYPFLKYLSLSSPGLPNAKNHAIVKSKGDIILFIDDDSRIHPDCIKEHLFSHSIQGIYVVAGRIKQMNGASWADTNIVASVNYNTGETTANFDLEYEGKVLYATGGHVSIKREVFLNSGLFNTKFEGNALYEDVEFFIRIKQKGYSVYYNPKAIIYHYAGETGGCHNNKGSKYLLNRIHNHLLFYILQIKLIPGKPFLKYLKNLIEFITRKKNGGHSMILTLLVLFNICKAYYDAIVSHVNIHRLDT